MLQQTFYKYNEIEQFAELALMHISIEPVKVEELQLLIDISRKTFYDTFHEQNTEEDLYLFLENSFNMQALEAELADEKNYFFFARLNDAVVGYLKLITGEASAELGVAGTLEISRIYIDKEKLGTGAGRALMEFSIAFARQMKKEVVFLGVWEHNLRAITFYRKFGFEKFSEHVFMLGSDAQIDWLMKKDLS